MKAAVAYEAPRRSTIKKLLKWHKIAGGLEAQGTKATYTITRSEKVRRSAGVYRWCLKTVRDGVLKSSDTVDDLKVFASRFDFASALPSFTLPPFSAGPEAKGKYVERVRECLAKMGSPSPDMDVQKGAKYIAGQEAAGGSPEVTAAILEASLHHSHHHLDEHKTTDFALERAAREAPTGGEWEVVVLNPPEAHRGAIISLVGPGDAEASSDRIIFTGLRDDRKAADLAHYVTSRYHVPVTFGPKNVLNRSLANETSHHHPSAVDEHVVEELDLYVENEGLLYPSKTAIISNLKKKIAKGIYEPSKAVTLWMYWVDDGAKRYVKEFGGGKWNDVFPVEVRRAVARRVEQRERAEIQIEMGARPLA